MPIAFADFSVSDENTRTDKMTYFKYIVSVNGSFWICLYENGKRRFCKSERSKRCKTFFYFFNIFEKIKKPRRAM
jgi:hypothetical protein